MASHSGSTKKPLQPKDSTPIEDDLPDVSQLTSKEKDEAKARYAAELEPALLALPEAESFFLTTFTSRGLINFYHKQFSTEKSIIIVEYLLQNAVRSFPKILSPQAVKMKGDLQVALAIAERVRSATVRVVKDDQTRVIN